MSTKEERKINLQPAKRFKVQVLEFISQDIRNILEKTDCRQIGLIEEIRLRADKPLMIQNCYGDWFVIQDGTLSKELDKAFVVRQHDIVKTLELMSENSIYAYQDEIKNGYITLKGGHRVGITGKVVLEGSSIKNIKDISGLNIRLSREIEGCSVKIFKYILNEVNEAYNTLIISPPQCGKTTIIRDIARVMSDGLCEYGIKGIKVGIVDERSEIAACFKGIPQNNVGVRTDVIDGCPKALGMLMLIRSMSPQVIITDEIGNQGDKDAIINVINAGVKIITTAHGYNISQLRSRQEVIELIERKIFERYIVLSNLNGPGTIEEVIDGTTMKNLFRRL